MTERYLRGGELIEHLAPLCGVDAAFVQRIIIDADMNSIARVYIKMIGSRALLEVKLDGAEMNILKGETNDTR